MNPFTESTVARPLACQGRPHDMQADKPNGKRKRRSHVGMTTRSTRRRNGLGHCPGRMRAAVSPNAEAAAGGTLVAVAPAATPPVAPSIAGTFMSVAGVLAAVFLPGLALALDVNVATQEQLRKVRGIGPKTAQIIIEERSRGGRYESLEDLSDRVKGIGAKKAAALQAAGLSAGASGASGVSGGSAVSGASAVSARPGVSGVARASPAAGAPPSSATQPPAAASSAKPSAPAGSRSVFRLSSPPK
jgi:competence protein ComEA